MKDLPDEEPSILPEGFLFTFEERLRSTITSLDDDYAPNSGGMEMVDIFKGVLEAMYLEAESRDWFTARQGREKTLHLNYKARATGDFWLIIWYLLLNHAKLDLFNTEATESKVLPSLPSSSKWNRILYAETSGKGVRERLGLYPKIRAQIDYFYSEAF